MEEEGDRADKLPTEIIGLIVGGDVALQFVAYWVCRKWYEAVKQQFLLSNQVDDCNDEARKDEITIRFDRKTKLFERIVSEGHLNILMWMHENGWPAQTHLYPNLYSIAAENGRIEVLKWMKDEGIQWDDWRPCTAAAKGGQGEALKWLRANGFRITGLVFAQIAKMGDLDTLSWLVDYDPQQYIPWDLIGHAAGWGNHLEVLKYVHSMNGRQLISGMPFEKVAKKGGLDTLKWYLEIVKVNNEEWKWQDRLIARGAAKGGHKDILLWLQSNGYDPYVYETTCAGAAVGGQFELLRQLKEEQGCPWDEDTCAGAAESGDLEMLKWARGRGCPWDPSTCERAARGGYIEILKYARENGCAWNEEGVWYAAAAGGHMEILKYVRECGCAPSESACTGAASAGHLAILKWLHKEGFPWGNDTGVAAASGGHDALLAWAEDNGLEWDSYGYAHGAYY